MANLTLVTAADILQKTIPNIPSAISGAQLYDIVDRVRLRMEDYTGATIGSTAIITLYQPALINLSTAALLRLIHLQGGDTSMADIRIGRAALDSATEFEKMGIEEMRRLGMKSTITKVYST